MNNRIIIFATCMACFAVGIRGETKKTSIGFTTGGQHIFYDIQVNYEVNTMFTIAGLVSYFPTDQPAYLYGVHLNYFPFENWFAISPGASYWMTDLGYSIFIPSFGLLAHIRMGKNWFFETRPYVAYQTRKEFVFPWVGATFGRAIW